MSTTDQRGFIEPEGSSPAAQAGELVVDGLLRWHAESDATWARVDRVLSALDGKAASRGARRILVRLAVAASLVLVTGVLMIFFKQAGEPSALAEIRQVIAAMRQSGDRRFEVRVYASDGSPATGQADTIDTRSPQGHVLIRHQPPWEDRPLTVGRDDKGPWALGRDGSVDRDHPRRSWPPWSSVDVDWNVADSVDKLLEVLPNTHDLKRGPREALPDNPGPGRFDRITATRRAPAGPKSDRVELWIDPVTRVIERIEMRWDRPASAAGGERPRREHGQGERPPGGPGPGGAGGHRPPPPGPPGAIIFRRVDVDPFPADWFSPEGHAEK